MRSVRFTPRFINRCVVGLALIAPIVYLFGSLFTGLIGAHGQQVYADEETSTLVDNLSLVQPDDELRFVFNDAPSRQGLSIFFDFTSSHMPFKRIIVNGNDGNVIYQNPDSQQIYVRGPTRGWNASFQTIYLTGTTMLSIRTDLQAGLLECGSLYIVGNSAAVANSEYVFSQFFTSDNFVAKIGEDCMSANPHGFAPIAALYKYIDTNMLHLADYGVVGYTAYGYMYWCAHVLLLDLVFYVGVFFIRVIKNVLDKLEGGSDL